MQMQKQFNANLLPSLWQGVSLSRLMQKKCLSRQGCSLSRQGTRQSYSCSNKGRHLPWGAKCDSSLFWETL